MAENAPLPDIDYNVRLVFPAMLHAIVKPIRVLAATVPEAAPVLGDAYPASEFEYTPVLTLNEAIAELEQPYDLIACSVHFNDGQFYDFLRIAKAHPIARDVPFLVHFTGMENKRHYVSQSVEIASKALGAAEVIPIYQWRSENGNEAAFKKYREVIRKWVGR